MTITESMNIVNITMIPKPEKPMPDIYHQQVQKYSHTNTFKGLIPNDLQLYEGEGAGGFQIICS